jgi:hypothetical protein
MKSLSRAEEVFWPHKLNKLYNFLGSQMTVSPGEVVPGFASMIYGVYEQNDLFMSGECYAWEEISNFRAGEPVAVEVTALPLTRLMYYGLRGPRCKLEKTNCFSSDKPESRKRIVNSVMINADSVNAINALCGYTKSEFWPMLACGHGKLGDRALLLLLLYTIMPLKSRTTKFFIQNGSFYNSEKKIDVFEHDGFGQFAVQGEGVVYFAYE